LVRGLRARGWVLALLLTVASAAGCGERTGGSDPDLTDDPAQEATVSTTPEDRRAQPAIDDLAARLSVKPEEVEVVLVEGVTWRDGSLGCAKPGMRYTQALVEGTRVRLRVGERTYEYHAGGATPPFLCAKPTQ